MSWRLEGTVELEGCSHKFSVFARENADVLATRLGGPIFPGSLNIKTGRRNIGDWLDRGFWPKQPDIVVPRAELSGMPAYIGDGRAWRCVLMADGAMPVKCLLFRRRGSRVRPGTIEILAGVGLVSHLGLKQGQSVCLEGEA